MILALAFLAGVLVGAVLVIAGLFTLAVGALGKWAVD